jgi:hypothetical protein
MAEKKKRAPREFLEQFTTNPWIEFARDFAKAHGITLGCAIRNPEARKEYNTKYKVVKSIKNVPPQLQAWVEHSKASAKNTDNNMSCCFTKPVTQNRYRDGNRAVVPKTPARVASLKETEEKLEQVRSDYDDVIRGKKQGNRASLKANVSRLEELYKEKLNEHLKDPAPDAPKKRYRGLSAKAIRDRQREAPNKSLYTLNDLKDVEEDLEAVVQAYTERKAEYTADELAEIKQHAKELRARRAIIKKRLHSLKLLEKPPVKHRQKKGGSIGETARLGHPGVIEEIELDEGTQIPVPPVSYNQPFGAPGQTSKASKKFTGRAQISDVRLNNFFNADRDSSFPM